MPDWIRRKIMPSILEAIMAADRSTHVFYITSAGGEGKTVLLRQIGMELGSPDGTAPCPGWSGILDLYYSDVNTNSGLENHLSHALETALKEFEPYRSGREPYAEHRAAGMPGGELETERRRMANLFAGCVNAVTRWKRVTVALDTTERIQYEVDAVQRLCGMQDESTTVKAWLLSQLGRWQNCVVLLVGRPEADPYLSLALEETLADHPRVHYKALTLGRFDQEEAQAYFARKKQQFPVLNDLEDGFYHELWEVTEGRPIRLDLAIEVIQHGLGFDRLKEKVETGKPVEVRAEIDRMLIEHVMSGEPDPFIRDVLVYLAAARKGLDASLLHHLAGGWDMEACQERLDAVARRSFVKRHVEDQRLYLHDEMYQLCDTHLLHPDQVQELSQRIARWYDAQIEAAEDEASSRNVRIDSLLYRLRADPQEGYHWYADQAEYAIRAVQVGFDMRLRNELIAFQKSPSPIDERLLANAPGLTDEIEWDSAARWVKRLMARGDNQGAIQVAERVTSAQQGPCQAGDPRFELARADLSVYHAQALFYAGQVEPARDLLATVISELERGLRPEDLAQQVPTTYRGIRRNLVLGRAHNNLGYLKWTHLGHYEAALRDFRDAVPYFLASDLREELANTRDNMGRVYALRRHPTRGAALVDDALELRRALAREYRVALSLNSRAIVHLEFEELLQARRLSQESLDMSIRLGAQRGIGLASITLGESLRRLGSLWTPGQDAGSYQEFVELLGAGAEHLDTAMGIFQYTVNEPIRLVEALNEQGSVYRERARLAEAMGEDSTVPSQDAIGRLTRCIELARDLGLTAWCIDSCEDLAQVHLMRHSYADAAVWLDTAEEFAPSDYLFREDRSPQQIPEEECIEAIWLQMGRVELLRGSVAFDAGTEGGSIPPTPEILEDMVRHYVLSVAYFERYSDRAKGLQDTFRQMYDRLKRCPFDDLRYLQQKLPDIARVYSIEWDRFGQFFWDTLGLALEL